MLLFEVSKVAVFFLLSLVILFPESPSQGRDRHLLFVIDSSFDCNITLE